MTSLGEPVAIGGLDLRNRLYRAPLLECAGTGPATADRLLEELEPAAASGAGLLFQGATIVTEDGGCAAPGMTRVADPDFVETLAPVPERIGDHGAALFAQLEHGGLRSMEVWHAGYRREHPELDQLAVSRPPWQLRVADRLGLLSLSPHVLDTSEVDDLLERFVDAADALTAAGYHGLHVAGANMGIVQQFCSPYYNRRADEFGEPERFLEALHDRIRERVGSIPLVTKVPVETARPPFVRRGIDREAGVDLAVGAAEMGYDAVVPVETSTFWDMSVVRGAFPERAWASEAHADGYDEAFGSRWRTRLIRAANRLHARSFPAEPAWNASLCAAVRERVDVPVLAEGGIRSRETIDRLLGEDCDMVGLGRPFYAEPRLPTRLLGSPDSAAVCADCNNCTVPQVTGAEGICRTPSVLRERRALAEAGAYDGDAGEE